MISRTDPVILFLHNDANHPFQKRSSAIICLVTFLAYILSYRPKGVT